MNALKILPASNIFIATAFFTIMKELRNSFQEFTGELPHRKGDLNHISNYEFDEIITILI
jgi:hypothetical protein